MVLMQLEMPLETVVPYLRAGPPADIRFFWTAGPAMQIPLERLRGIFIISPNEAETKALTGIDPDTEQTAVQAAGNCTRRSSPSMSCSAGHPRRPAVRW